MSEHPADLWSGAPAEITPRPLLIYDGDCGFCVYWARYWQRLTGNRVRYRPYQDVAAQYPEIPLEDFRRAVQYIAPDGRRVSAAEASFMTLSHAPGRRTWLALYQRLPGFAAISERLYAFIAANRSHLYRPSLLLWGKDHAPARYELVAALFLRLLGLIYLAAFVSFGVQAQGLIGSRGILPLTQLMGAMSSRVGAERFFQMPMVFWWNASDLAIQVVCWTGAALSVLLTFGLLRRVSLLLTYVLYLSLLYAGQDFMTYQWDVYLLETGFLALLLSLSTPTGLWLLRWLLFRFMFMSGVVKLSSGDPTWHNLSALSYHFLTQPLPTPLAWYAATLPAAVLKFATGGMFFIEPVLPFLIFCPRRLRFLAAFGILLLQTCISITGNYNWFNLQTTLLCLLLFDDAALHKVLPRRWSQRFLVHVEARTPHRAVTVMIGSVALLLLFGSLVQMDVRFGGSPPAAVQALDGLIEPLRIANSYGLFAVMTTQRNEIVIEGSDDGVTWQEYEFRYKPGALARRPSWNIPNQPRLDWQMWFAALDDPRRLRWFQQFLERLLENEPSVTALLAHNPFVDRPPKYVRAQFYVYTYSNRNEKATGLWWDRRLLGSYFPAVSLKAE